MNKIFILLFFNNSLYTPAKISEKNIFVLVIYYERYEILFLLLNLLRFDIFFK